MDKPDTFPAYLERRTGVRQGFSEWDDWHEVLPGHSLLACATYCGPDAPDTIPAGYMRSSQYGPLQRVVMRPFWHGLT